MDRLPGATVISSFTQTASSKRAIALAVEVLTRFREKGITEEQLASAKAYVKGTFPPSSLETPAQIAQLLGDLELHGLRRGEIDDFFSRIDAVTLAQANAAIQKHYTAGRLQFCLVGNAAKIEAEVRGFAREVRIVPASDPGVRVPRF
jgi:predicted Zn-dependent peptidase